MEYFRSGTGRSDSYAGEFPSNSAEGVEGIDAGAYISQINETAASVSSQAAQIQSSLNSAADQMNQTAAGLKAEAETLKRQSGGSRKRGGDYPRRS